MSGPFSSNNPKSNGSNQNVSNEILDQLKTLNKTLLETNEKISTIGTKTDKAHKELNKIKTAVYSNSSDNGFSLFLLGLFIIATLAFITNPSVTNHKAFLQKNNMYLFSAYTEQAYDSYYLFSIVDINGEEESGTVTFGLLGKIFRINEEEEFEIGPFEED